MKASGPWPTYPALEKGEVCSFHHTHLQLLAHWWCSGPLRIRTWSPHAAHPVPTLTSPSLGLGALHSPLTEAITAHVPQYPPRHC